MGNNFNNYFTIVAKNLASKINTNQSLFKIPGQKTRKFNDSKSSNKKQNKNSHKIIR